MSDMLHDAARAQAEYLIVLRGDDPKIGHLRVTAECFDLAGKLLRSEQSALVVFAFTDGPIERKAIASLKEKLDARIELDAPGLSSRR